jgi:hypothetical protein
VPERSPAPLVASAIDFVLEGLYAQKKISRSDEFQYQGAEPARRPSRPVAQDPMMERDIQMPGTKKKYYN